MSDDTITAKYEASLVELGFNEAHDLTLAALLPDYDEREAVALHVAHQIALLDPNADLRPSARFWAATVAEALRRRYPQAAEQVAALAGQGVVLLSLVWTPESLPPPAPPPALFTVPDATASRSQQLRREALAAAEAMMKDDATMSGATIFLPDGDSVFVSREQLLRKKPGRSDS